MSDSNGPESLDADEEPGDDGDDGRPSESRPEADDSEASTTPREADDIGDDEVSARERLEAEADRAVTEFDEGVVDLLAWVLDTETRARIYVYLRQHPNSTSDEVAEGTGLYPSTVREALAQLHDEETVDRHKRESAGAGNNPYEYEAIAPSTLVRGVVGQVQEQLNAVFNLDQRLGDDDDDDGSDTEPVRITVEDDDEE